MTPQRQSLEQLQQHQQLQMQRVRNSGFLSFNESPIKDENDEVSRSALAAFMSKEEEIERRKTEVKEKVKNHLGRVEEASKRLAEILDELEALTDPMRKEVGIVRKKIDIVNRELKPLGLSCQKKEREYREVLEAFNERSKEKAQLVAKLMELVSESEKLRMKKLEELSKSIESLR